MSSENFVKTYVILYSNEGSEWKSYTDGSNSVAKVSCSAQTILSLLGFRF